MRQHAIADLDEKVINEWSFGALITNYVQNFAEDLPESDKVRSLIDYQFEHKTKAIIRG